MSSVPTVRPTFTLGDRIRRLREEAKLDMAQWADLLYTHRNTITNWEKNKRRPSPKRLRQIAEVAVAHTDYDDVDEVLAFLLDSPVAEPVVALTERRQTDRRTPTRKRKQHPTWGTRVTRFPIFARRLSDAA